jgi:hypothetical protein
VTRTLSLILIAIVAAIGGAAAQEKKPQNASLKQSPKSRGLKISEDFRIGAYKAINAQHRIQLGIATSEDPAVVNSAGEEADLKMKTPGDRMVQRMWGDFYFLSELARIEGETEYYRQQLEPGTKRPPTDNMRLAELCYDELITALRSRMAPASSKCITEHDRLYPPDKEEVEVTPRRPIP